MERPSSAPGVMKRPHAPSIYPVVIVGSGPGGLQISYDLTRVGVHHAMLSRDATPGGMFRSLPVFQRLITWSKPFTPVERATRAYERFDWNSLLAEEQQLRALVPQGMDGSSYFPSRPEMELGLAEFAERARLKVRYGCTWEATRREDGGFVVVTGDGEYRCRVLVVAVGMTQPWKPDTPGIEHVPHYVETGQPRRYADRRVFVIGKGTSAFEVADGLLPWARQLILASPRPVRLSVVEHTTAVIRARYLQPYEDYVLAGGNLVVDAAIERVERHADGWRVFTAGTNVPGRMVFEADDVICATGFTTPLGDLPALGVQTFYGEGRLPAQTPFWESPTMPGVYFVGSITQGAIGMKKYGIPSNSAAVHGFRYNARVLARHLAETHFGVAPRRRVLDSDEIVPFLLDEVATGPELWNQPSYLCRVVRVEAGRGVVDEGIVPLAHFVDSSGPNALAVTIETDDSGSTHPCAYLRRGGTVEQHVVASHPLMDFRTDEHRAQLEALVSLLTGEAVPSSPGKSLSPRRG